MISFENVTKIFDKNKIALQNLSFEIEPGELIFLTGKSGAGKSTVIDLITLREAPTNGAVKCLNFDLSNLQRDRYWQYRRKIGVIFQDFNLIETLSIFENIALALEIIASNRKLIQKRVFSALEEVDMLAQANSYPRELSGGERQRIAVARAIINKPKLLLADEPTGSLDPENANTIFESLFNLNAMGATIIIATHNEAVVTKGRQLKLQKGSLLSETR